MVRSKSKASKKSKQSFSHKRGPELTQPVFSKKYAKPHKRSELKRSNEMVINFGRDENGNLGFQTYLRPTHRAKIQDERNKVHYHHLTNYTKLLHLLDVDVKKHVEEFGIDRVELERIEGEVDAELSLSAAHKSLLKETLVGFEKILRDIKIIDAGMWGGIITISEQANFHRISEIDHRRMKFLRGYSGVSLLPGYSGADFKADALKTYNEIKKISDIIWASVYHENKMVKERYFSTLDAAEKMFGTFIKVEKELKAHPGVLGRFHDDIFKIVTQDILELTQDILKMYDVRLKCYLPIRMAYNVIIDHIPGKEDLKPGLEKEHRALEKRKREYWNRYEKFCENVMKSYAEGVA